MLKLKLRKGFTLVELLVVIAIIGVIAALVIVNLSSARAKGRDAKRKQDIDNIRTAVESYIDENPTPPGNDGTLYDSSTSIVGQRWSDLQTTLTATYIPTIPKDPQNTGSLIYTYKRTVNNYEINAAFEKAAMNNAADGGADDSHYEIGSLLTVIAP